MTTYTVGKRVRVDSGDGCYFWARIVGEETVVCPVIQEETSDSPYTVHPIDIEES